MRKEVLLLSSGAQEQTASVLFAGQESAALDGEIEACDRPSLGTGVPCTWPCPSAAAATGRYWEAQHRSQWRRRSGGRCRGPGAADPLAPVWLR
ncbi:hypothetical protein TgHK011_000216 [Trichoderma gracile]|nr:hypothetical protein TgHK011_000216 [Trichoderma gracile]